jgi:short-subunit dehydrogenase
VSGVVVVTGASAGVGRATAVAFAKRGWRVGLLARGLDGLEGAAKEVAAEGGTAVTVPTDVARPDEVEAAADAVEATLGPIDVWVNDAMVTVFAPFAEITAEEFRRATEVTYLGTVHGTMSALRRMRTRGRGKIVQVGSALSYRAIPLQAPYCGAKHAVRGFTNSLRTELLHEEVDVSITMVQLPAMNTPQFDWCRTKLPGHPRPVPPIYQPEVAAEAIWRASHGKRREIWVGVPTVATILGSRLAPALLDHYLARTGYESQQTDERVDGVRPDNLLRPLDDQGGGDRGAHGGFDEGAHARSYQTWVSTHRRPVSIAAGTAVAAAAWARRQRQRHRASRGSRVLGIGRKV